MSYSVTIQCETYERFKEVLDNMDEICKRREASKKKDRRGAYMKTLHERAKIFHEQHSLIPYHECIKIVSSQMRDERESMEDEILLQPIRDMSGGTVV